MLSLVNPMKSIQLFDKVLAIDANNTDSLVNKGLALYNQGRTDEAGVLR